MKVDVVEAEKRLWELIEAAQAGEEVIVVDVDSAAVRLVPILKEAAPPEIGDQQ